MILNSISKNFNTASKLVKLSKNFNTASKLVLYSIVDGSVHKKIKSKISHIEGEYCSSHEMNHHMRIYVYFTVSQLLITVLPSSALAQMCGL